MKRNRFAKSVAMVLVAAMVLAGSIIPVSAAPSRKDNLLLGLVPQGVRAHYGNFQNVLDVTFGSEKDQPLTSLTDGDTQNHIDIYGSMSDDEQGRDLPGFRFDLGKVCTVEAVSLSLFALEGHMTSGVRVYASESLDALYSGSSLVYSSDNAPEAAKTSVLGKAVTARYIAFFLTASEDGAWRCRELQAYGREYTAPPEAASVIAGMSGQGVHAPQGNLSAYELRNFGSPKPAEVGVLTDGDTVTHIDFWNVAADGDARGLQYDLGGVYDITSVKGFVGIYNAPAYAVTGLRVYASQSATGIVADENLIYNSESDTPNTDFCKSADFDTPVRARYVIFLMTQAASGFRAAEFQVFGTPVTSLIAGKSGEGIRATDGNFAATYKLDPTSGLNQAAKVAAMTDGNVTAHMDMGSGFGDKDAIGYVYDLGGNYVINDVRAYVGIYNNTSLPVSGVRIYASESQENLYTDGNIVYNSVGEANGTDLDQGGAIAPVTARYVAFLVTAGSSGDQRWREFAVFGTPAGEAAVSVISGLAGQGIRTNGSVFAGFSDTTFNSLKPDELTAFTDGDTATNKDLWGGVNDGDYRGMRYDLGSVYTLTQVKAFAGVQGYPVTGVRVYASQTLSALYDDASIIMDTTDTPDGALLEQSAQVNSVKARYVAFLVTAATSGDYRIREFEAYGTPDPAVVSAQYRIDGGLLMDVKPSTALDVFAAGVSALGGELAIVDEEGFLVEDGVIATGMAVQCEVNGVIADKAVIVVSGDVDGDGAVNASDVIAAKKAVLGGALSRAAFAAADQNGDGSVDILDLVALKRAVAGL